MNVRTRLLETFPLLSLLPRLALRRIISKAVVQEFPKGTWLFREGASCESIFYIISGRCEASHLATSGRQEVIEILGPGDTLGESDLLGQGTYRTTARVATDSVMLTIESREVRALLVKRLGIKIPDEETPVAEYSGTLVEPVAADPSHLGHIVSVVSLCREIPDRLLLNKLTRALHSETRASVLLIELRSDEEPGGSLDEWDPRHPDLHEEFYFDEHLRREEKFSRLRLRFTGGTREAEKIAPLLSHCSRHFTYVLVHAVAEKAPLQPLMESIIQADDSYFLLPETSRALYDFKLLLQEVRGRPAGNVSAIKPVLFVNAGGSARDVNERFKQFGVPIHTFIHRNGNDWEADVQLDARLRSLAREIGRCRIGLALSSGGAKGLAHIGVFQVLEELGIEADIVAGTSMGAYVGAVWAAGFDGRTMQHLANENRNPWGTFRLLDPVFPPRRGFVRGKRIVRRLKRSIGDRHFCDMVRPLRVTATRLDTLERTVFSSGEVAAAVHASIAIPGVCTPVEIDGETYVDGGISDPLPVSVLCQLGIERIIAINTIPTPERMRYFVEMERERELSQPTPRGFREFINRHINYFARGNLLDIMMRSAHGASMREAERSCKRANLVLRPQSIGGRWHDFQHPETYISIGRKVAEDHAEELKALAGQQAYEAIQKQLVHAA